MSDPDGLICAYRVDAAGQVTALGWHDLGAAPREAGGYLWVHLDRQSADAERWLRERSGIDPLVQDALLAEETRPRCSPIGPGFIVNLRGVNLNPGAAPEDMVSLRIWIEEDRIISVRLRRLMAVQDIQQSLEAGTGPRTTPDFLIGLAERLAERMEPVIAALEDELDGLEALDLENASRNLRTRLRHIRRKSAILRRFIAPQRDALSRFTLEETAWVAAYQRHRLRETADDITRFVELLNVAWERAAVMQDELTNRLAEQTNERLYLLSLIAGIFLPLSFVTGLLGINVGGIPAAQSAFGFAGVVLLLLALGLVEIWLFRRLRWL